MTEAEKTMKKYMNAIERRLRLPLELRARVMADLSSTVVARREAGQSDEEIMARMGRPKEVADELNQQMAGETFRKSPWRWLALAAAIWAGLNLLLYGVGGLFSWLLTKTVSDIVGVIGGADGPTAIFVSSSPTGAGLVLWTAVLVLGVWGFWRLGRCKRK